MISSNFQTSMNISYCLSLYSLYYYTVLKFKIFKYKTKVAVFFDQSSSQLVHVWNLDRKSGSPAESKSKPGHLTGRVIIVQPPNTPSKNVPHKLAYPIALYPMLPTIATCYRTMLLPIIYFLHEIFTSWSVFLCASTSVHILPKTVFSSHTKLVCVVHCIPENIWYYIL